MWKEWDKLLQRDAETRQWIIDLLVEAEKERDLRLGAKERSATLEQRAKLDAETVTWLHKKRDELRHTVERLRSEHDTVCEERDQAVRERDEARQVVSSLWTDLGTTVTQRLEAESISAGLGMKLVEV